MGAVTPQMESSHLVRDVEELWDLGLVVCTAAGNEGKEGRYITSPGISRKVITVGASDDKEMIDEKGNCHRNYSGRGPTRECICKPEIVAKGTNILSTNAMNHPGDLPYTVKSGTSMATPMVSGAIALLLEKYPDMNNRNVKLQLWKSVRDLGLSGNHQGWGMLDVKRLLEKHDAEAERM